MKDIRNRQITVDDIVRMSGCYFPENDGKYIVLQTGEIIHFQRLEKSTLNECSLPRAIVLYRRNSDRIDDTIEIIGKAGSAVG